MLATRQPAPLLGVAIALAITFSACSPSGGTEVTVSSDSPDTVDSPTPQVATPEGFPQPPEPTVAPEVAPAESPDTPGLVWTEVDLADAIGADEHSTIGLKSVGDGRVLAMSFVDRGIDKILVTDDSTEWAPIPVPAGFLPWEVDIIGDRWLIQGWDSTVEAPSTQILFSDDQGASWTELVVDLGSFEGTAWITGAIVAGERIVVMAQSDAWQPDIDQALDVEMAYEPSEERVHLFLSNGGPPELVAEFPGWASSGGYGASDGFHLILYGPEGDQLLYSPNGRQWTTTSVDVEITDSARSELWTTDETDGKFRVERFEGVYGWDQVLTLPYGIGWMPDLAVGPAGVAGVGGPATSNDEADGYFALPDIVFEKDGYELRYNQPVGGITLWSLENDSAVHVFDAETLQSEGEFRGVSEVEDEDGSMLVVFLDPETGTELVTFSDEELAAAVMEAESAAYSEYDPNEYLIGWSVDGSDWEWQTLQEAFGLPERNPGDNSFTEVQVAVGQSFVLAQVQTFEFPEAEFDEDLEVGVGVGQSDSTSAYLSAPISPSPPRWFIARVG